MTDDMTNTATTAHDAAEKTQEVNTSMQAENSTEQAPPAHDSGPGATTGEQELFPADPEAIPAVAAQSEEALDVLKEDPQATAPEVTAQADDDNAAESDADKTEKKTRTHKPVKAIKVGHPATVKSENDSADESDSEAPIENPPAEVANNMIPEVLQKIGGRIDALEQLVLEAPEHYKTFWSQAKVITDNFKHYGKLIPKETHEELWKRFDSLCEATKAKQEEQKSRFARVSRVKREAIEKMVNDALELLKTDITKADGILRKALNNLKDEWGDIKDSLGLDATEMKVRMGREDQDAAWQQWKSANEHYFTQLQQARQNNFIAINQEVAEAKVAVETGDAFEALALIKKLQGKLRDMRLPKGDWEEIQNTLREYWNLADKRIKEEKSRRGQDRTNRNSIFQVKHQEWITRQESNVQRFEELIRKNNDVLKSLEEHTEKLKNDLVTAASDKFKQRIEDWIKEKEGKIIDISHANADLKKRITDVKNKLAEEHNAMNGTAAPKAGKGSTHVSAPEVKAQKASVPEVKAEVATAPATDSVAHDVPVEQPSSEEATHNEGHAGETAPSVE